MFTSHFVARGLDEIRLRLKASFPEIDRSVSKEAVDSLRKRFRLLGAGTIQYSRRVKWQADPLSGKKWRIFRNKGYLLTFERNRDVKYVWELNRHQHFFSLAKAYLLSGDERYAREICDEILDWIRTNRPNTGINWTSALELAIRIISWLWAISLISDADCFNDKLRKSVESSIRHQAQYIHSHLQSREFPNNHLIAEAAALVIVGIHFPQFKDAERWRAKGLKTLEEQMARQTFEDGVDKEQTLAYHRFVLDLYTHVLILCRRNRITVSEDLLGRLELMYEALLYTMRPDGTGPMIGDDDTGRAARLSEDKGTNFPSALSTAAVLFNRGDMKRVARHFHEESFWLFGQEGLSHFRRIITERPKHLSRAFNHAGIYVMRSGWDEDALYMIFDCGPQGMGQAGHGHADALSFELSGYGKPLIIDPGTYTYNGPKEWRNYFRGSYAHNTVVVDGLDQAEHLQPYDQFGWKRKADGHCLSWHCSKRCDFVSGYHDGYERLASPVRHRRDIFFVKPEYWIIVDFLIGDGKHHFELLYHFPPGQVCLDRERKSLRTCNKGEANIYVIFAHKDEVTAEVLDGSLEPIQGWVSYDYGHKIRAPVLDYSDEGALPLTFLTVLYPFRNNMDPEIVVNEVGLCGNDGGRIDPQARCIEIRGVRHRDYYLISPSPRVQMRFADFETDATMLYLRQDDRGSISHVVLQNVSFLDRSKAPFVCLEKAVSLLELDIDGARVDVNMSDSVPLRLYLQSVESLKLNGIPAEVKKAGGYYFVRR